MADYNLDYNRYIAGSTATFEVNIRNANSRYKPIDPASISLKIYSPKLTSDTIGVDGFRTPVETISSVTKISDGLYQADWDIPYDISDIGWNWEARWFGNFYNLVNGASNNIRCFHLEKFQIDNEIEPSFLQFGTSANMEDLFMALPSLLNYLPSNLSSKEKDEFLKFHLEQAEKYILNRLNLLQLFGNSQDKRRVVAARAIYTILRNAKTGSRDDVSQGSDIGWVSSWKQEVDEIVEQYLAEGSYQSIPMGR